jgi:cyclohexyl-isocyanide hydratase
VSAIGFRVAKAPPEATRRAALAAAVTLAASRAAKGHDHTASMERLQALLVPARGPEDIVFLVYPGCTALDFVGPHNMLRGLMGATVRLVAKTREPIITDTGLAVLPDLDFASCPEAPTLICVPGGSEGTLAAMEDEATIAFLAGRGRQAAWITGVCTGTLLLGAAGLLHGYRATSHWLTRDLLPIFGANAVDQRVVFDRNRVTGGGVTAGIDFGLAMVAALRDDFYAKAVQLVAEYDPAPPFDAGSPNRAPPEAREIVETMFAPFLERIRLASETAAGRMPR